MSISMSLCIVSNKSQYICNFIRWGGGKAGLTCHPCVSRGFLMHNDFLKIITFIRINYCITSKLSGRSNAISHTSGQIFSLLSFYMTWGYFSPLIVWSGHKGAAFNQIKGVPVIAHTRIADVLATLEVKLHLRCQIAEQLLLRSLSWSHSRVNVENEKV